MNVTISGGLGFIGSRLGARLHGQGHHVVVLDNIHPQVHGTAAPATPVWAEQLIVGDVRNPADWDAALEGAQAVFHLAAETGTGQSMDEISRYCDVNVTGTARLAEALGRHALTTRVFLASSRAIYGEGAYHCSEHGTVLPQQRTLADLQARRFALHCPICSSALEPVATSERIEPRPISVYASTKLFQEQLLRQICAQRGVALRIARFQNVYGPGQSLRNAYTGVLAIFARQVDEGRELNIYEDGQIARDFIYIEDVVDVALRLAFLEHDPGPINVGTGKAAMIDDVIGAFQSAFGHPIPRRVSGDFRFGDIRYAVADVERLRAIVDPDHFVSLEHGIRELTGWVRSKSCRS